MIIDIAIQQFGTQEKLALELGVRQQTVSDWLHGKIKPSIKNTKAIEKLTGISREQIRPDVFC